MQKHLQRLLLLVVLALPWASNAQSLSEYAFATGVDTSKWITVPATTPSLITPGAGDYGVSAVTNLGFAFTFGEGLYTQFSVNADGNIRLGSTVTGTSNYTTPFSSSNAATNNPKINFFGCDGYCDNSHYVRYIHTEDANGDSLGVIEYCMGTYTSSTRPNLYKWQVHLYHNGTVEVVYGVAPSTAPAVSRQVGLCENASSGWVVSASHAATAFTNGSSSTIATGTWPTEGRYYTFSLPNYSCPRPTSIAISNLTTDGFDATWVDTSDAQSWIVTLANGTTVVYNNVDSSNSVSFTSLTANTNYTLSVSGLCTNGDTSTARVVNVKTLCTAIDVLPYNYGFEDAVTGGSSNTSFVDCWNRLNNGTSYFGYPYVSSTSDYNHTPGGSKGLYWYNSTTAGTYGDYQCIVLPSLDTNLFPMNTVMLRFWARPSTTSYSPVFEVGVMTDPTDITTFSQVATINVGNSTTWTQFETMLNSYTGYGQYVAIRAMRPTSLWYAYVDDITLAVIPACPRVSDLMTGIVTTTSIDVAWSESGSATQWIVEWDTVNFTPGNGVNTATATDTTYTIDNLELGHTYYIYVTPDCGGEETESVGIVAATLAAEPGTVPFFCDFEGDCATEWDFINGTQTNAWYVGTATQNGGTHSMYISNNNGTSNAYNESSESFTVAKRTLSFEDAGEYLYSYDWRNQGESHNYDFGRVFLAPASYEWTAGVNPAGSTYNFATWTAPAGWIELTEQFGSPVTLAQSSSYRTAEGTFTLLAPGTYNLVFVWTNDGSVGTNPALAIDNVSITRNTCPAPIVTVEHVTSDSVILTWVSLGDETQWTVSDGTTSIDVYDTTYIFDNLNANTNYTFTVRAVCGYDDTSRAVVVSVLTPCTALDSLPYVMTFETESTGSSTTGSAFVSCWTRLNNGTSYGGYPYVSSTSGYNHTPGGSKGLYWYNSITTGTYGDYQCVVLPPVNTENFAVNNLQLSFWAKASSTSYSPVFYVGVMTNPSDINTFVPVDTINVGPNTTWTEFTTNFYAYEGNGQFVAVKAVRPSSSWTAYVDDFKLEVAPACPAVDNLAATNVTTTDADITWHEVGNGYSWTIEYGPAGFTPGTGTTDVAYDTTYTLTGLSGSVMYDVYVTVDCGSELGGTSMITFRTACDAIAVLPWTEDFEGLPEGASSNLSNGVPCWGRLDNASTYHFGYIGSPSSWPTGAHGGTGFLYYYMPTTAGTYADWNITILPPMNTTVFPVNTLQVSFWAKMNSASTTGNIEVGVMTDPTVASTFVPVDTVTVSGTTYTRLEAYLSRYTDTGAYIALRFNRQTSTTTYYFVDDVTVEQIPDCAPVSGIALAGIDSNMLSVTWTENGSATSWEVEYGPAGFTRGTGTVDYATAVPFDIFGLTPNTTYDVYITPDCGGGVAATRMGTFRTANTYIQLPFSCNFEDSTVNNLWTLENGTLTNKWYIGTATQNGGTHSMYISDNNGTSCSYSINSSTLAYAYVDVMLPEPGDYGYSFDWKSYGESTLDYIRAALVPVSNSLTAGTSLPTGLNATSMPADWISLDGNNKLNLQSNWQSRSDVITVHSAGVYHLVFLFRCDGSVGTNPPAAIDNVEFARMACAKPQDITSSNLGETSVDFAWTEAGTATEWQYQIGTDSPVTTYDTNCSLTGLTSNTEYIFRVRSICGDGDTSFWEVYNFRTICVAVSLPYVMTFESESTGTSTTGSAFVNCWTRLNNGTSYGGYPYVSSSSSYNHTPGGSKGLYWYNTTTTGTYGDYQCVVMPAFDSSYTANALQVAFWAKPSSSSYSPVLQVGVMTDPNNITTFVPVDTVYVSGDWTEYEVPLTRYTGTGRFVAIKAVRPTSSWYVYVDDISLDVVPTCVRPANVHSTANTSSTITLDWTERGTATEWEVALMTNASAAPVATASVTSHPYTATGLTGGTPYYIYVRSICGYGDTSAWSDFVVVTPGSWNMRVNQTDTVYMCGGAIYDDGGPTGTYAMSQNSTVIIMPDTAGNVISISGSSYTESSYDYITIYDGIGTSGTQLWTDYGISTLTNFGPFESTSGPITVTFQTDGSVAYDGFEIFVNCVSVSCRVLNVHEDPTVPASGTSLALVWDDASALQYQVEYGNHGFTQGTGTMQYTSTPSIALTGLTPMTNYDVYVRAICSGADTGSWTRANFTTAMCDNPVQVYSYDTTWAATTSEESPLGTSFYNYGYVQFIIDSAQLTSLNDVVTGIAYNPVDGSQGDYYTHMSMWLANVSESVFATEAFIHPDATHTFVKVLDDADLCYTTGGWQTVGLDTAFAWDGHSNILVTVARAHGDYESGATFRAHSTTGYKTIYDYQDNTPYNVNTADLVGYGQSEQIVPDFMLISCGAGCAAPVITSVTNDYESATITWSGSGATYQVAVKENAAATWPTETTVAGNTYTFNGLLPATAYTFRVRQDCTLEENGTSGWTMGTFITDSLPCFAPENLTATNITGDAATFAWTTQGAETNWEIHVWRSGVVDVTVPVNTNPATVTGLTGGLTYNAAVRALCGSALIAGDWSDTITFATLTCPDVTGLATSNVTFNSVDLRWDAASLAQSYVIEYGFRDFSQGQGTTVTVNTNSYQATGLFDETAYDFYVRAVCGTDWTSDNWVKVTATTASLPDDAYTVTLTVNDPTMGTVTGSGTYAAGTTVTISATANQGYQFVNWSDGNTDATRQIVVNSDVTLMATFASAQGIDEVNGASCTIYPNPATSSTTISVAGVNGMVRIAVVDMNGRVVATDVVECSADCVKTMDVDNLAQGAYFVRITGENVSMVKKLVVR